MVLHSVASVGHKNGIRCDRSHVSPLRKAFRSTLAKNFDFERFVGKAERRKKAVVDYKGAFTEHAMNIHAAHKSERRQGWTVPKLRCDE